MNLGQTRVRLVEAGAVFVAVALVAGCGSQYRPVVTPINPSGPAAQPTSLAVVVSAPSPTTPGIATIIDYSGDTVMATAPIGIGPTTFTLDGTGSTGYTVNSDGTLTNFPASTSLQAKNVSFSTLPTTAVPVGLFSPSSGLWISDLYGNVADVLLGSPETFKLSVPVAPTPTLTMGMGPGGERNYSISLNSTTAQANGIPIIPYDLTCNTPSQFPTLIANGQTGEADAIETASFTVSARIPVGVCPAYALLSADQRRTFVLNRGSDTVTVINSQNNTLDSCVCPPTGCVNQNGQSYTCHPSLPLSTSAGLAQDANNDVPAKAGPLYAEYNATTSQLVVADYDGNAISVIDVSMDEYGNDSPTFGTTFTIPVGHSPASVTALADGSRAYTANQADGTVTIVNLASHSVEKTLPVIGHPRTVVSTANSLYGKVYVASPDSPYLTILRTDLDIVDTTVLVQGNIVDVRVSSQNGSSSNNPNNISRKPGAGQPCYLPGTPASLTACQTLP
jgi:YVTN family beta-propeller protein